MTECTLAAALRWICHKFPRLIHIHDPAIVVDTTWVTRVLEHGLDLEELDRVPDISCIVHADDFTIAYVNPAWVRFGTENGARDASGVGTCLLDALPQILREFYTSHLVSVITDGKPWEHDYECASPELHREFRLRALPVGNGAGVLITHTLRVERPHTCDAEAQLAQSYRDPHGIVAQCAHCRRVHRVQPPSSWDWVPDLLAHPADSVSHGLCEACCAYYFSPAALDDP